MDTTTVTRIRFNNVRFNDNYAENVIAIITTKTPITIEEMLVLDRYGTEFIRDFDGTQARIRLSLGRRRASTQSAKYKTFLDKVIGFSYEIVE